jgi:hypothetical protein
MRFFNALNSVGKYVSKLTAIDCQLAFILAIVPSTRLVTIEQAHAVAYGGIKAMVIYQCEISAVLHNSASQHVCVVI